VGTYFDGESSRYVEERYVRPGCDQLSYQTRRRLALEMLGSGPGRLLDIGSGPGVLAPVLLGRSYSVVEVDLSLEMLRTSRRSVAAPGRPSAACFVQGRLPQLPFSRGAFDVAACIGVLAYLPDPGEALREIRRIVKPGGVLVLQVSNSLCPAARLHSLLRRAYRGTREALGGPAFPHLRLSLRAFRLGSVRRILAREGFRVESHAFYDFRPPLLQWVMPSVALAGAKRLQRLQDSTVLGWLGEGIVLKARADVGE
jgi:ubiquinone/menaquinone biosynthesis C-methylase UbiE